MNHVQDTFQPKASTSVNITLKWDFMFHIWAMYCGKHIAHTICFPFTLEVSAFTHQDNELCWPDKETHRRMVADGGVSEDVSDPNQAGTKEAELDTTVVVCR